MKFLDYVNKIDRQRKMYGNECRRPLDDEDDGIEGGRKHYPVPNIGVSGINGKRNAYRIYCI